MPRTLVYHYRDDAPPELAGWFDPGRATRFTPAAGATNQTLYRTEQGAWVKETLQKVRDQARYEFVHEIEAHDWLSKHGHADADNIFPDLPREQSPGRPEIGGLIQVRLGDLLSSVDEFADRNECNRAEAVRRLIRVGLQGQES